MAEQGPVRVREEVLEGLEAVRRYAGVDLLAIPTARSIPTARYLALEGRPRRVDRQALARVRAGSLRRLPGRVVANPGAQSRPE